MKGGAECVGASVRTLRRDGREAGDGVGAIGGSFAALSEPARLRVGAMMSLPLAAIWPLCFRDSPPNEP